MPTAYPRLNRGQIRARVRDLTNIEATLVVSDDRINNLINEELQRVLSIPEDFYWSYSASNPAGPLVTVGGINYKVPGWSFDNTYDFPPVSPATMPSTNGNTYLTTDASYAPWSALKYNSGYYDLFLVYSVASRLLQEVSDETNRAETFRANADEILNELLTREFVDHSYTISRYILSSSGDYDLYLLITAMQLLKIPLQAEAPNSAGPLVERAIRNEEAELKGAYNWGTIGSAYSFWDPYGDIFAYGAAARLAIRFGLSEAEQKALLTEYETRKQALLREKLYNASGSIQPFTFAGLKAQVRALLQDYTKDLPETLIGQWVNDAYQTLAYEREWRWLEEDVTYSVAAGVSNINLTYGTRVISMYELELDENNNIRESSQIYPVAHGYDVLGNSSDYRYSLNAKFINNNPVSETVVTLYPTPQEPITVAIRFADSPSVMTQDITPTLLGPQFSSIVAYRAAIIGAAFHPQAKQLIPAYEAQAQRMFESMLRHYQLDTSTETFSIGENALETRKYLPFFRVG